MRSEDIAAIKTGAQVLAALSVAHEWVVKARDGEEAATLRTAADMYAVEKRRWMRIEHELVGRLFEISAEAEAVGRANDIGAAIDALASDMGLTAAPAPIVDGSERTWNDA